MEHCTLQRLERIYTLDEAQLIIDELPSDGDITEEEADEESDIIPSHELPFELLSYSEEMILQFLADPPDTKIATSTPYKESLLDDSGSLIPEPGTMSKSKCTKPKSTTMHKETANVKPRSWKRKKVESTQSHFEVPQGIELIYGSVF